MGSNCYRWAHCGHIIQQHLKCPQFLVAGYIGVTLCLGSACLYNVPTGYLTPCPQCERGRRYIADPRTESSDGASLSGVSSETIQSRTSRVGIDASVVE